MQPTKAFRVFQNPNADFKEPRVVESLSQIHKDPKYVEGGQSGVSSSDGVCKPTPNAAPTCYGEFSTMNREVKPDLEENIRSANPNGGASLFGSTYPNPSLLIGVDLNALAEVDGIRVSKQEGRFVHVSSNMDSSSQKANDKVKCLIQILENVFRKKTFDCRKCSALSATKVTKSEQNDFWSD
ncbi:hypothetical protein Tco_1280778 [Tanacetum coccineum]